MQLTKFEFFYNTPLTDFQNTIHFKSNLERDKFFDTHYNKLSIEKKSYNYVRSRLTLDVNLTYDNFAGLNYGRFNSGFEPGQYFYFYVIKYEYINDSNVRVYFIIDPIMTYTQGDVLNQLTNLSITRQHLTASDYNKRLPQLLNNDDILTTSSKKYFKTVSETFTDFYVIFQCSVDLEKNFGTEKNPKMSTSSGTTYDKILSPVNIYIVDYAKFNNLMKAMQNYPWITQNISKVTLIPKNFVDSGDFEDVKLYDKVSTDAHVYTFKKGTKSQNFDLEKISFKPSKLYEMFNIPIEEKHLLRSGYCTAEVYSWDGQELNINLGQIDPAEGIQFKALNVIGYANKISFYLKNYQASTADGSDNKTVDNGSFLNSSITYENFDEVPVLVDNYKLGMAKNAHQRQLSEDRLLTNRVQSVANPHAQLQDRFMNAVNLVGNLNPTDLFGKFSDEYEFYRDQKAQFADMKLSTPTITNQSTGNAFQVANNFFGLTIKFSKMSANELRKVRMYYKEFGYQIEEDNTQLSDINSMSIANFVQFSGPWTIPGIDVSFMEQMKAQFENGVRLWHNNGTDNPMTQDLINNHIIGG